MAATADMDYAFELQLLEALKASLIEVLPVDHNSPTPRTPRAPADENEGDLSLTLQLQAEELERYEREAKDRNMAKSEMERLSMELHRLSHDASFARTIHGISDDEWEESGDNLEQPLSDEDGEGAKMVEFMLFFKGFVSTEMDCNGEHIAGAGIAIYDAADRLILEMSKPLGAGLSRLAAEYIALTEGLTAAHSLGVQRLTVSGDSVAVYKQVLGQWNIRQQKIMRLYQDAYAQTCKFDHLFMSLIPKCDNRYALSLAREAIESQLNKIPKQGQTSGGTPKENCSICFEDIDVLQMHENSTCGHRYCYSCMNQHVEVQIRNGLLPKCPHDKCNSKLTAESCKGFLSSKLLDLLTKRLIEASIPDADKVYCPYSNCSALMSRSEFNKKEQSSSSSNPQPIRRAECNQCNRFFCIECRVPWHQGTSCQEHQRRLLNSRGVEARLHSLARQQNWRRCKMCKHMIELAQGCNHITCRCGYEFCYVCGAEWKDKKPTCKCVLWDENNIVLEPLRDDFDSDSDSEEVEEYDSDEDFY